MSEVEQMRWKRVTIIQENLPAAVVMMLNSVWGVLCTYDFECMAEMAMKLIDSQ